MLKYRGIYRVVLESDKRTGKPLEFICVPCRVCKGSSICRHSDNILNAYIPSTNMFNRLLLEYPDLFTAYQTGNGEGTLLFNETDMETVAEILKPGVLGKNLNPKPKRQRCISEDQRKLLSDRMKQLNNIKVTGLNARKTG